jgi:hypothetical protein
MQGKFSDAFGSTPSPPLSQIRHGAPLSLALHKIAGSTRMGASIQQVFKTCAVV